MSETLSEWKADLARGARRLGELADHGHLTAAEVESLREVGDRFRFRVSGSYLDLVDWSDPDCPIRKQAIPSAGELVALPGEMTDPIGDRVHRQPPAVVHRYGDRALLFPTLECPMFCRYCFRKIYLADEEPVSLARDLDAALEYLAGARQVREVILSGGDPLLLSTARLSAILERLAAVEHIRRLRVHTRVPATLATRLDAPLAALLGAHQPLTVVGHFNHPRELTVAARAGLERLRKAGVPLANQSVLLRGVNDHAGVLKELFEGLLDAGVRPYYLHHPDLTVGTQAFRVSIDEGLKIVRALRGHTSGLALPEYVIEVPGGLGKVAVDSRWVRPTARAGVWTLKSPLKPGLKVTYVDPAVHPRGLLAAPERGASPEAPPGLTHSPARSALE